MKNIILLFTLSLYFINCGKELKQEKKVEKVLISVHSSKHNQQQLNLLFDFSSDLVLLFGTGKLNFERPLPPPPPDPSDETINMIDEVKFIINTETFILNKKVEKDFQNILLNFKKDDYKNLHKYSLDGNAVAITYIYCDRSFKRNVLINDSTVNQRELLEKAFELILSQTKQTEVLERYYKKNK